MRRRRLVDVGAFQDRHFDFQSGCLPPPGFRRDEHLTQLYPVFDLDRHRPVRYFRPATHYILNPAHKDIKTLSLSAKLAMLPFADGTIFA